MTLWLLLGCAPEPWSSHTIDGGRFLVVVPEELPAPVMVFAHGWRSRPEKIAEDDADELAALAAAGVLVLLPAAAEDGEWNTRLSDDERDDMAFMAAMLDEADARWGIDPARVWGSGFSEGGSVAHNMGCHGEGRFTGLVPLSGTFWEPLPADCGDAAVPIRHVHGAADETWPPEGQRFSPTAVQGNIEDGIALWRQQNGCSGESEAYQDGPLSCTRWLGCAGGDVELCLHDGGHVRRSGWGLRAQAWLSAR